MQTYIALVKLTDKGRIEIAESLKRGEYAQEIMQRNGVEMREYYLTIGAYDFVLIFDAQHERGMAQTLVEIGRLGANPHRDHAGVRQGAVCRDSGTAANRLSGRRAPWST